MFGSWRCVGNFQTGYNEQSSLLKHKSTSNPKISKSDAGNTPLADPNIQLHHDQSSLPTTTAIKQLQSTTLSSQSRLLNRRPLKEKV
ncbi:kinesin-like protein KIN-12F isoform X1 [Senna tora]|uniref:Kinesin-like protein KIN-12F isoform X1 n=1 Tax=Senna tora TaxID=362788 RepID=A0A834TEI2_9FABA|nr:kinesin-like protein KIN-12F isoform X1 [Senna tora]